MMPGSPEQMLAEFGVVAERFGPGREDTPPRQSALDTVSAASLASKPVPTRAFLDGTGLFPIRNVTILSGDGGTGKSLLSLQLAAAVATATKWLDIDVRSGPVLYCSAEDDLDEMHIRLTGVCAADGLDLAHMADLQLAILAGRDAVLGIEAQKPGTVEMTPLFDQLRLRLDRLRPRLLVLDNLADMFAGNENVRPLARQFIGALRGIAMRFDCAVLLLAHPSLSGLSSGSGSSGNTAWNNSVRSRLYLMRDKDKEQLENDPHRRILQTMKANYGPAGGCIAIRWEAGRFIRIDGTRSHLDAAARAIQVRRVFLHLLGWHIRHKKPVSPSRSPTYAPALFARHQQSEGVSSKEFEMEMNVLLEQGEIRILEEGSPSRLRRRLVLASEIDPVG